MKIHPRITFKVNPNATTSGITELYYNPLIAANKPVGIMTIGGVEGGDAGRIMELINLAAKNPEYDMGQLFLHYRLAGYRPDEPTRYIDVPNYDGDPVIEADKDWALHLSIWKKHFGVKQGQVTSPDWELAKKYCWFQINNEPRKEATEWLAEYGARLLENSIRDGVRQALFAWSAGNPGLETWETPKMRRLLQIIRENPQRCAIALHEYSLNENDLDAYSGGTHLIGRWLLVDRYLFDIPIIMPEWGWGERGMPWPPVAIRQIEAVYEDLYAYPNIIGLAAWTLIRGWGDVHEDVLDLMPRITQFCLENEWTLPDMWPPTAPWPTNLIYNGDFESGWDDVGSSQQPKGWDLVWNSGMSLVSGVDFIEGEVVHKGRKQLPEDEWHYIEGEWVLKVFGAQAFHARLAQNVKTLPGKKYKVIVRGFCDAYKWDGVNKKRLYGHEHVDQRQAEVQVLFDRVDRHTFFPTKTNSNGPIKFEFEAYYEAVDVETRVALHFKSHWGIATSFFIDNVEMIEVVADEPPVEEPVDDEFDIPFIWAAGMGEAPLNMDAALQKRIIEDGWSVVGRERWHTQPNGLQVAVQPAHLDHKYRRVYFAKVGDWDNIMFATDESSTPDRPEIYEAIDYPDAVEPYWQCDPQWRDLPLGNGAKSFCEWSCLFWVNFMQYKYQGGEDDWQDFHARYKAAGSFSGSNLVPGALSKAYPGMFNNNGWLPRGHQDFLPTMAGMLSKNEPVAIRVDFKPTTPGEEQHWVLVTEMWKDDNGEWDFTIVDPWDKSLTPKQLSQDYNIPGLDALELLWYTWRRDDGQRPLIDLRHMLPSGNGPILTFKHFGGPHNGAEEHIQYQGRRLVKDQNYEEFWFYNGNWVRRIDTSMNDVDFYWLEGPSPVEPSVWLPGSMRLGERFTRQEFVQISRKDKLDVHSAYRPTTTIKLERVDERWPLPDGSTGVAFIFVAYDYRDVAFERYVYVENVGMVRWENILDGWHTEAVSIKWQGALREPTDPPAVAELKRRKGWV